VAGDDGLVRFVVILIRNNLVQDGNHEHCRLAHPGLSLAEDVVTLEGERDSFNLDFTWMFEPTLADGSLELILEEKLVPSSEVGALVLFLLVFLGLFIVRAIILGDDIGHGSYF